MNHALILNFCKYCHWVKRKARLRLKKYRTSLAVQWLRLHTSAAVNIGSVPGQGAKIHMPHGPPKKIQSNAFPGCSFQRLFYFTYDSSVSEGSLCLTSLWPGCCRTDALRTLSPGSHHRVCALATASVLKSAEHAGVWEKGQGIESSCGCFPRQSPISGWTQEGQTRWWSAGGRVAPGAWSPGAAPRGLQKVPCGSEMWLVWAAESWLY